MSVLDFEVAWAAGLFEGEGCFDMYRDVRKGNVQLRASLAMTDKDVVYRFHEVVGFGALHAKKVRPGCKPAWLWVAYGENVKRTYAMFAPWLGERRRHRYAELLAEREAYERRLPAIKKARAARAWKTRKAKLAPEIAA